MWVRPNRNFDTPSRYFFGVALTPHKDHWVVNGLLEGGKAEKVGVKRGDRIVKINGKTPSEMNEAERKALTRSREPWRATIDRNGTISEIVIECED
jgi:C-terminal processing protease CtpA/Prc